MLSDRGAALLVLSVPGVLALVAFLVVTVLNQQVLVPQSAGHYAAAAGALYLLFAFTCLPAYAVSWIWYWWRTRQRDDLIVRALLWMPPISAVFAWFPSTFAPQDSMTARLQVFAIFAFANLVAGYLWVGVIRFLLRFWRKL